MTYDQFSEWFDSHVEFGMYPAFLDPNKLSFDELISTTKDRLWHALIGMGYSKR